jgi:putative transcriptional regulator
MIHHHPSDATLVAHAAGNSIPGHSLVIRVHLTYCPRCRGALRLLEEIGGGLVETLRPVALSDGALARTLARLEHQDTALLPPALPKSALDALATGRWRWLAPGIRLIPLARRDAFDTRLDLIRVDPGTALPQHDHTGPEITCILQGGYRDETGDYHVGDIAEGEPGLDHAPVALDGAECVCVIATTGRLRARSMVARVVQRFVGI